MTANELAAIERKVENYRKRPILLAKKDRNYSFAAIDREIKKLFKRYKNLYINKSTVATLVAQALKVDVEDYMRIFHKIENRIVAARIGDDAYLEMQTGSGYRLKVFKQ